jgi:mono/diheme cytochrome c family protein
MRAKLTAPAFLIVGAVLGSSAAFEALWSRDDLSGSSALAQELLRTSPADVQHGATIARRWCSSCHVVASNQRQVTGEAPPFEAIARRPDFDQNRLAYFLLDPHPKMPDMGLSRTDAADLAAYIGSLGK